MKGSAAVWASKETNCTQSTSEQKSSLGILLVLELGACRHTEMCTHTNTQLIKKLRGKKKTSPGDVACFTTNYQRLRATPLKIPSLHQGTGFKSVYPSSGDFFLHILYPHKYTFSTITSQGSHMNITVAMTSDTFMPASPSYKTRLVYYNRA